MTQQRDSDALERVRTAFLEAAVAGLNRAVDYRDPAATLEAFLRGEMVFVVTHQEVMALAARDMTVMDRDTATDTPPVTEMDEAGGGTGGDATGGEIPGFYL